MGVYIKDMEMPKDGHFIVRIYANGEVCVPSECPGVWEKVAEVVPVLPHGRLIDADALIADFQLAQKQADRHGREFANAFYFGGGEVSTEWWCVESMVDNALTIIPAEEDDNE